ncbi:MAG: bifunctional oligoribonuclease/PAP phosphatase NrnA [Lachnospiraceae bacterium]
MMEKLFLNELLETVTKVAIAGHTKPDGDCVGSCLGLYNYIKDQFPGTKVDVYLEPIPPEFEFLRGADKIKEITEECPEYDVFFALDCGDESRLSGILPCFQKAKKRICIDHHCSNTAYGDINYVVGDASSTSELIYHLIGSNQITKETAECLYMGIAHDTGIFQYSCTSPDTMEAAAELMRKNIDFTEIIDRTFYEKTYPQNQIMGEALCRSKMDLDGKLIYSVITFEQMAKYGASSADLDGIVSQLRVTTGVEVSLFLYETGRNSYKVSMRSKSKVDVAKIAVELGGGGHVRAAGASVDGTFDEIIAQIKEKVRQQL